jgi:hypothetical protein
MPTSNLQAGAHRFPLDLMRAALVMHRQSLDGQPVGAVRYVRKYGKPMLTFFVRPQDYGGRCTRA